MEQSLLLYRAEFPENDGFSLTLWKDFLDRQSNKCDPGGGLFIRATTFFRCQHCGRLSFLENRGTEHFRRGFPATVAYVLRPQ